MKKNKKGEFTMKKNKKGDVTMKKVIKGSMVMLTSLIMLLFLTYCGEKQSNVEKHVGLNVLTKAEKADGWQLLFDGKSLDGWRGIGIETVPSQWEVKNGAIHKLASGDVPTIADGRPLMSNNLMSKKTFKNFELSFEWAISKEGNSGVKYNVSEKFWIEKGGSHALGYEYQVLDDPKEYYNPKLKAGALYALVEEAEGKVLKPVGKFNSGRIIYNGSHIEHWLNGKKVAEADTDSKDYAERFKTSKYYKYTDYFNEHKDGHIVLQDHGDECWYRNIKIKILD